MWINHKEWGELLVAKANYDFFKQRLEVAESDLRNEIKASAELARLKTEAVIRVRLLEKRLLAMQDEINKLRNAPTPMVSLDSAFEEDIDAVKRDRDAIKAGVPVDKLLLDDTGDE